MTRGISRTITRRLEAEGNSKRVLKPKKIKDTRASASSKGKEAAAKAQGYAEEAKSKDGLEREESSY
jgi:hypothetical protein